MLLLAVACGTIVANLYYAQPLVGLISKDTGISAAGAGLIVTLTQVGYGLGLLFIVPLSDLIETKKLTLAMLVLLLGALALFAVAHNAATVLAASVLIGIGAVATQILVPFAAYMASEEIRGRVVGMVMSGLLIGIMFSRPASSFITEFAGWHAVFIASFVVIVLLMVLLYKALPSHRPESEMSYFELVKSLGTIFMTTPALRRRAFYQASLFASFSLFWTVVPMYLTEKFHLSQTGIAFFALAGVAGAVAAPIAGRLADKGYTRILTGAAIITAALSFIVCRVVTGSSTPELILLTFAAVALDMSVSGNLVLGQKIIYSINGAARGRLNGVFMAIFFMGGAVGSAIGSYGYAAGGWHAASWIGFAMPALIFIYYLTEYKTRRNCHKMA